MGRSGVVQRSFMGVLCAGRENKRECVGKILFKL